MRSQNGIDRTKEIKEFIEEYHKGKGSPIKIKCLLPKLQSYIPDIENRDMRKAYETLVLCWGKDGIYAPATEDCYVVAFYPNGPRLCSGNKEDEKLQDPERERSDESIRGGVSG